MEVTKKIELLREAMKKEGVKAYIIPSSDPHQSEYLPQAYQIREWFSGFTGSAGTLIITMKENGLWTDGRYFVQAEAQLKGSGIDLFKMGNPGVPSMGEWLADTLEEGDSIGLDGKLYSQSSFEVLLGEVQRKNLNIKANLDLYTDIWEGRPSLPKTPIINHDLKYAGKSTSEKIEIVRAQMKKRGCDNYVVSTLDDIAWLFNIRGNDIDNNPVAMAYAAISMNSAILFMNTEKISDEIKNIIESQGVEIREYDEFGTYMETLSGVNKTYVDPARNSHWIVSTLQERSSLQKGLDITVGLKTCKNETEIENMRRTHIRDGVAMVKFLHWFDNALGNEEITEISAADKLEDFRSQGENFMGLSFDTIAGYKDHGAIVHYKAEEATQHTLKKEGLFLLDSGGQYLDGTTDITRTLALGNPTDEEKEDYTLVLKGHIGLNLAKFRYGLTGPQLDILARKPLWERGMDYNHGTGHGIGFYLGVHEGPQRIAKDINPVVMEEGMVTSNEPGLYKEGKHGIRLENIILTRVENENEFGKFMGFEVLTLCPFDKKAIVKELMTEEELAWLNGYHKTVYEKLNSHLDENQREWLAQATEEI